MTELEYYNNNELAATTWRNKYAFDKETSPKDMHKRIAKEFAEIEKTYPNEMSIDEIFKLIEIDRHIILGGSGLASLGTDKITSLSNCFVIDSPEDSYSSIMRSRTQQIHLMKRRGGVGYDLSKLRPRGAVVHNSAKQSTGAASFMEVCSEITKEVAQGGRRGALMLSMDISHPDILEFITSKQDLTKITGANISVKVEDAFMKAVEEDTDYFLRYPINSVLNTTNTKELYKYDELYNISHKDDAPVYIKKVKAKELWNSLIHCAWNTAEPGILFIDRMHDYAPDGIYPNFKTISTNPCFHPNTIIETINGPIKIKNLTEPAIVYSMDIEGKLVLSFTPGAFKTKNNAKTLKITLRNGSSIQVTPDHKLYAHDLGWVEAKDLQIGNRLAHILRARRGKKYVGIKLTTQRNRDYVMEHRFVYSGIYGETNKDIHHVDGNTFNNNINNLFVISHNDHSRKIALEQNPQIHQERDSIGRSKEYSKSKIIKGIETLPEGLATKFKNKYSNTIISIEEGETTDVYDIQVCKPHCVIANGIVAHNCGEIGMGAYDSCRLIHLNLTTFVDNPFTSKASFNYEKFKSTVYKAMYLADDLVDLEIQYINRIIDKISKEKDTSEIDVWKKILETTKAGRRSGLGSLGIADVFAQLGIIYGSEESIKLATIINSVKMESELKAQLSLAKERGAFPAYNHPEPIPLNSWENFIKDTYPVLWEEMLIVGRRNISWSTMAPTGTLAILAGVSSGIEPVFMPYYTRKRKCSTPTDKVDYIDKTGQKYSEFVVVHQGLKQWYNITYNKDPEIVTMDEWKALFLVSPYYKATAEEIAWENRIKIQKAFQDYTTHSISSTINLPKESTEKEISDMYFTAWKQGLKGLTVYRAGCREGILNNLDSSIIKERPKQVEADYYQIKARGIQYIVIIGLLNNKPYEVFTFKPNCNLTCILPHKGIITKVGKNQYNFISDLIRIDNMELASENTLEKSVTVMTSYALRDGVNIEELVRRIRKIDDLVVSFSSAMCRILLKYSKQVSNFEICPECGGKIVREGGCQKCLDCSYSKCL